MPTIHRGSRAGGHAVLIAVATALALSWMIHALPGTSHAADRSLRIMPIGDSITEAKAGTPGAASYRQPLWARLATTGVPLDFVGSRHGVYGDSTPSGAWDKDHDGHWGWRADQILNGHVKHPGAGRLGLWAGTHVPDVALIHIGTNDVLQGQGAASTANEIRQMIDVLRASNADVRVVVAKLIPTTKTSAAAQGVVALNAEISKLGGQSTSQSPVVVADLHSGYNPSWNYDAVHPGPDGLAWMAEEWAAALSQHNMLAAPANAPSTSSPASPTPTTSTSPSITPSVSASPSPSSTGSAPVPTATGTASAPASPQARARSCQGRPATVVGTRRADTLVGTRGADVFVARAGADSIRGRGGADVICAGRGDDVVAGGRGRDVIHGGAGADSLRGGRGADIVRGGAGLDVCTSPRTAPGCN